MNQELFNNLISNELGNKSIGDTIVDGLLNIVPDVIVINTRPIKDLIRGTYDPRTEEKIFHVYYDNPYNNPLRPRVLQVVEIISDRDRRMYSYDEYYRLIQGRTK